MKTLLIIAMGLVARGGVCASVTVSCESLASIFLPHTDHFSPAYYVLTLRSTASN